MPGYSTFGVEPLETPSIDPFVFVFVSLHFKHVGLIIGYQTSEGDYVTPESGTFFSHETGRSLTETWSIYQVIFLLVSFV